MATSGGGRDAYGYQGYGSGAYGALGRANANHPETQNDASISQNHQGYPQVAGHLHQGYYEQTTFRTAGVIAPVHRGHNQLHQPQNSSPSIYSSQETFQGEKQPSSYAISHHSAYAQPNSNPNYPVGSPSDAPVAGSQSQAPPSYVRSPISYSSGSQQGRTTYRRRPPPSCEDSDEGMSDADDVSTNLYSQGNTESDFSNLSTHSRRKMYVAGLEGYLSGSREALMRNGHELPRVKRAATSRGLDGPIKIDMLTKMERRNADLRAATRLKEESSSPAYRPKPKP